MRWAVATRPRGTWIRSACVPVLKLASHRPILLRSLDEIRPLDRPDLTFEAADSWVMEDVYWFGVQGYEGILADLWTKLCRNATSVLEIGGNVGLYSVLGGKVAPSRYTVIEPLPELAALIRANLRRNGLNAVEVLQGAAIPDREPRVVSLNVPDEGRRAPTGAYLVDGSEIRAREAEHQLSVQGLPIASLIEDRDLIKMDAEGIEHALLKSCKSVLLERHPTVVIEVLPESTRLASLLQELASNGKYTIYVVPGYGSEQVVPVKPEIFTAELPQRFHSKDVVLTTIPIA